MKKIYFITIFIFAISCVGRAQTIALQLNLAARNQMNIQVLPNGTYQILTTGTDPYIYTYDLGTESYDFEKNYIIAFEYQAVNGNGAYGIDDLQIFYGPPITGSNRVLLGKQDSSSVWKSVAVNMKVSALNWNQAYSQFRFDPGISPDQTIKVRNIVLRAPTPSELAAENFATDIPVTLNLSAKNQMNATLNVDSSYTIQTLGTDPYVYANNVNTLYDFNSTYYLSFDYKAATGLDDMEVFFGPPITQSQLIKVGPLASTSTYKTITINLKTNSSWKQRFNQFRFDFGRASGQNIQVKNIRLRNPTTAELEKDPFVKNASLLNYLNGNYSNKIQRVKVDSSKIQITGSIKQNSGNLYLCELRMYDDIATKKTFENSVAIGGSDSMINILQDRFVHISDTTYDRLYSRWVIAEKTGSTFTFKSYAHYANEISEIAKWDLPEEKPLSKKGVGGFGVAGGGAADLTDLDLHNVTVNVVLTSLISLTPTSLNYTFNGQIYYFNPAVVANFDNTFKTCADKKAMVSLILLIPRALSPALKAIFVHPDADNGPYSMANMTSLSGTNYYAACIGFLSERYYRPDQQYGKINHWIIHNEVDAGYYWTNAGKKPMELYTELYDRSMRTVYYTARRYNPTAKVFISLTHFWTINGEANYFAPQDMLNTLTSLSAKQGDYEWGVAYHPYPADLREPKTWADAPVNNNLNTTSLITPKNIELIDTWMRQKSSLYQGLKVRTLLFSEQGINSKSYSSADLQNQAAGIAYMWKKFNRLPSLEGFQYHRRVDNSGEGGLLLGLWTTKPGTVESQDYRKPSWTVLQAANTSVEDSVFAFALPLIGISNWPEIYNPLVGEVNLQQVNFTLQNSGSAAKGIKIEFNGEFHDTDIEGKVIFYNVASIDKARKYRFSIHQQLLWPEKSITVQQDIHINQNLAPVDSLSAKGIMPTQIAISWKDRIDFEKGFVLERKQEESSDFTTIDTLQKGTTYFIDKAVTPGKFYSYRIYAYNDSVKTLYSDEVEVLAPNLTVLYLDGDKGKVDNNSIKPFLKLKNEGTTTVDLSRYTLKYWFVAENYALLQANIDYAQIGRQHIHTSFTLLDTLRKGANACLELSFDTIAFQLNGLSDSGPVQLRINKTDWSDFDETNDYSYQPFTEYSLTSQITLYKDGQLIWGDEPQKLTEQPLSLKVLYNNLDRKLNNNQIKPGFKIVNEGAQKIDYKDLKIKYWFTAEGNSSLKFYSDYAEKLAGKLNADFQDADLLNADHDLEIGFTENAGSLYGFSNSGRIETRFNKADWSNFNEANDYSYADVNQYSENPKITLYYKGNLVYGTEPSSTFTLQTFSVDNTSKTNSAELDNLTNQLYPNPAKDKLYFKYADENAKVISLQVSDLQGIKLNVPFTSKGNLIEMNTAQLTTGTYTMQLRLEGKTYQKKFLINK